MLIIPYKFASNSAKSLAKNLDILRYRRTGKTIRRNKVINWGCSSIERAIDVSCSVFNKPKNVSLASNKINTFANLELCAEIDMFKVLKCPSFTVNYEGAKAWVDEGAIVFARTIINGHSGEGIVDSSENPLPENAPLYVKYIPKEAEYRVHIFDNGEHFIQQKKRKLDVPDEDVNWKIRNHQNGFIYGTENVELPEAVVKDLQSFLIHLNLDFGAFDVIYNQKRDSYYLLEVNTAPGITGKTLDFYTKMFEKM